MSHAIIVFAIYPSGPIPLRSWWEMHCSCGAWQHGPKARVEYAAALHRVSVGESAP